MARGRACLRSLPTFGFSEPSRSASSASARPARGILPHTVSRSAPLRTPTTSTEERRRPSQCPSGRLAIAGRCLAIPRGLLVYSDRAVVSRGRASGGRLGVRGPGRACTVCTVQSEGTCSLWYNHFNHSSLADQVKMISREKSLGVYMSICWDSYVVSQRDLCRRRLVVSRVSLGYTLVQCSQTDHSRLSSGAGRRDITHTCRAVARGLEA